MYLYENIIKNDKQRVIQTISNILNKITEDKFSLNINLKMFTNLTSILNPFALLKKKEEIKIEKEEEYMEPHESNEE